MSRRIIDETVLKGLVSMNDDGTIYRYLVGKFGMGGEVAGGPTSSVKLEGEKKYNRVYSLSAFIKSLKPQLARDNNDELFVVSESGEYHKMSKDEFDALHCCVLAMMVTPKPVSECINGVIWEYYKDRVDLSYNTVAVIDESGKEEENVSKKYPKLYAYCKEELSNILVMSNES